MFFNPGGKGMGAPEGAIRVPGIIKWSEKLKPGNLSFPTSQLDMLPSLLELAGFPTIENLLNFTNVSLYVKSFVHE